MYYKPESLEENFSNVLKLRDNFMNNIKSYMWEYDWICTKNQWAATLR